MAFEVALAEEIWTSKYRFKAEGGEGDGSFGETAERVARAVAEAEDANQREQWQSRFRDAIADMRFIPAGRVLAGAGTDRSVTLFNCFVMGTIPDSLDGIFEHLKQAALTMQQGGGVGMDFSTVRPAGSVVRGVGADASGPLTFMD
jgi:ribonucleoside-diphosphate reductase alpha chain